MTLILPNTKPSWGNRAENGEVCVAPNLWKQLAFNFDGKLGPTGTVLYDASLKRINGAITGATWERDGLRLLSSASGCIDCGDALDIGSRDYTLVARMKHPPTASDHDILWKGTSAGSGKWFNLRLDSTGVIQAFIDDGSLGAQMASSNTSVEDNQWHHIAAVFDRDAGAQIYIDGNPDGALADISDNTGSIVTADSLGIGCKEITGVPSNFFDGTIAEVAIYNRALTTSEVKQLHEKPGIISQLRPQVIPLGVAAPAGFIPYPHVPGMTGGIAT